MKLDWKRLSGRERMVVMLLGITLSSVLYFRVIHKPFGKSTQSYKQKIQRAETKLKELKLDRMPLEEKQVKLDVLKVENSKLVREIKSLEKELPMKKSTSQLIGELTRLAEEAKLVSISQKNVKQDGYDKIFIDVKLSASYPAVVNYIMRIESISPFIRIEELDIREVRGNPLSDREAPVRIVVSSLMGDEPVEQMLKAKETGEAAVKRDILLQKDKPAEKLDENEYKLEGITYNPVQPTAIINGEVYRVDSQVKNYKIKEILPNSVILTDGGSDFILNITQ